MKSFLLAVITLNCYCLLAQENIDFNHVPISDKNLTSISFEPDANAVVLYELGENIFEIKNRSINVIKTYYSRLKILNKNGFNHSIISIPYYKSNSNGYEKISKIEAYTLNGNQQTFLKESEIYDEQINQNWFKKTFTFPNVKKGSILVYKYELESPFVFNLTDWVFQSSIPKLSSQFKARIPGNYVYHRELIGALKLSTNSAEVVDNCFEFPGYTERVSCETLDYKMDNIPAFIAEDYMLSEQNYISKLKFELSEYYGSSGNHEKYSKNWKEVDKEFKYALGIGKNLKKRDLLKPKVNSIENYSSLNKLDQAKAIYHFIKNYFTWNNNIERFKTVDLKKALDNKIGSDKDINLALINAYKAAGFQCNPVILSTKLVGLPSFKFPSVADFNYLIAELKLSNQTFYLDATDKNLFFGMLPPRAQNYKGRSLNFETESDWVDIYSVKNNKSITNIMFSLSNDTLSMQKSRMLTGHYTYNYIKNNSGQKDLINEDKTSILIKNKVNNYDYETTGNTIIFNPFTNNELTENPFKLNKRSYPIDFSYPREISYRVNFSVPNGYTVSNYDNINITLPDNGGILNYTFKTSNNTLQILFNLKIKRSLFLSDEYEALKNLFNSAVKILNDQPIVITKDE